MSHPVITPSAGTMCDECGKTAPKIWRVYKGHKYCGTCYAREFKRAMCPRCGNYAKLPRRHPEAVCSDCEKDKPCARCGRPPKYPIGKITEYGPVCNACSPYFSKVESCEACCTASQRLSRISRLGHDLRVCPKCASAAKAICTACRKHRVLLEAPDGRMLCKKCLELGQIPCPQCQALMPAGMGAQCDQCQWDKSFRKKLNIDLAAFSTPGMAAAFAEFGDWLSKEVGSRKAAITIHRYLPFFLEIEKQWKDIPDYPALLKHFSAEGLRRVRLPMKWLKKARGIMPDAQLREDDSDLRRIEAILASVPEGIAAGTALRKYHRMLQARLNAGETSIRSIRLALRPAASLLLESDPGGSKLPDQAGLLRYLHMSAGQRAAVTGFVNFLNTEFELSLLLPKAKKGASSEQRKKLEAELLDLMRVGSQRSGIDRRWLSVGLAYFHGLPRRVGMEVQDEQVRAQGDGLVVEWRSRNFWLPSRPH
ncbi:MAG: hypothetical protein FNT29_05145 [Halothiobacillaceae bacterium]|nr:MAG: hypothetical protein FNT29_05145 [Halothiobacillaceae bacterium]